MARSFKTLDDMGEIAGKRVLVREDLNVPMADGQVTDDTRLRATLPTVTELADRGAIVLILAHFGRPKGKRDPEMSLALVTRPYSQVLGRPVRFIDDCQGDEAAAAIATLKPGDVAILENTRFHPGEEKNDPDTGRRDGEARRSLCQRRLFRRAPRACLDRGPRPCPAGLCRPRDGGRARRARQGARQSRSVPSRRWSAAPRCRPSSTCSSISSPGSIT